MEILQLFFDCDELCREFLPQLAAQQLSDGKQHRQAESSLSTSEVMTIIIALALDMGYTSGKFGESHNPQALA